jgi:hypothetical protein
LLWRRPVLNGAFRQRVAEANAAAKAASDEGYAKTRKLEDALTMRQHEIDELERSRATLVEATTTLLETFEDRGRALQRAKETIKSLAERNAQLEAAAVRANAAGNREQNDPGEGPLVRELTVDGAGETTRKDWAELAGLLSDFVERKRQSSAPARSMTLLASTVTF